MTPLSSTLVPYEGPDSDYKILAVGEAPGGEEAGQGRPFIGRAGQFFERQLQRVGIPRADIKLANLCNYRPLPDNKFRRCLGTPELEAGLQKLEDEIRCTNPNLILALGGWPLYYLTGMFNYKNKKPNPGSGILTYRGSRLPAVDRFGGPDQKVLATMHPSFVLRSQKWTPVFHEDLKHAVEDSFFPELRLPEYDIHIDPEADELYDLVHKAQAGDYISIDIETFRNGTFSCIGFTSSDSWGCTVTYQRQDLHRFLREIWECDTPKIFQYGTYDISFMRNFYDWRVGGYYNGLGWDTYVASANILPDYPRRLDFLCSLYTRFPYYKDERKVWRESDDMDMLWKYNIKDCIATWQIAMAQMTEIPVLYANAA